jgi:hypothetical protein
LVRAWLRAAVLQVPAATLKMSTTLEPLQPAPANSIGDERVTNTPHATRSCVPLAPKTHAATTQTNTTTRTCLATSEDRDSRIRQRCGNKVQSSLAEGCSAPSSRSHVEDVHNIGAAIGGHCTRHETCTSHQHATLPPLMRPPRTQNTSCNNSNKHNNTYPGHQRRSRLPHSAAMWRQDWFEPG